MPYLQASPADLQRAFRISDEDLPDAAVIVGVLNTRAYGEYLTSIWPTAREIVERVWLVEADGQRVWYIATFGGAMAATYAHLAVKLGARAVFQFGVMGGLQDGWDVGDVLVPDVIIGRDGVSRQLSRNRPIVPERSLTSALTQTLSANGRGVRTGTLVTTTTISFERPTDIARWRRAGYAGVEMEAAATLGVAAHFGVPATSAFVLMDNLAVDHTVFAVTDADRLRIRTAREAMERSVPDVLASSIGS